MLTKKWLFVGLFTVLSVGLGIAAPPAVHPVTGEPLIITCLRGTPAAIDGDLADWNLQAMTPAVLDASAQIYTGQTTWTGVADCGAKFYLLWDDTKIYIGAIVTDDKIVTSKTGGDIWNCDCAEIFFGTTATATDHSQHYQFGFNAVGQYWNWCNMDSAGQSLPAFMQAAAVRTPTGYTCEVAIEHARMSALSFVAGNTLGFHPCIDDTEATDRELQITWTGREAHDQSLGFGYLILSADPAIAKEIARNPKPENGAADVKSDAVLSWQAGQFAASHDVYFGASLDDVNNATRAHPREVLVGQGQADARYDPQGALEYGRTYYWRVDEVNGTPDATIFKGQLWSFTTEPYAYPITSVTATASASQPDMGPENTIDGSGLDDNDAHSSQSVDMWMSAGSKPHWIQYEFDKAYKLYELWVWNSNQLVEAFLGLGAKTVTIEYSLDGQTWTALEGVPEFARAPAAPGYKANTAVPFGGATAKYVKLTIEENWGGVAPQTGLSEVRFFYVPVQAFGAEPADGATEVSLGADLTWRPGREAESHVVYFGADEASLAKVGSVAAAGYTPASLDFGTTYYWKVDEIGGDGPYEGDVWSFVTQEYATVDDMEGYNDTDRRIYDAWVDGVTDKASGSQVGYDESPFAEKAIVHGGKQSMPLMYNNAASPYLSEATCEFGTARNWTGNGASEICLWTRGYPAVTTTAVAEAGGKMTLTGSGADIWGTSDECTYAYKTLTGDGTIIARVTSTGTGTQTWAKGGVMIRDSINGGAAQAIMAITTPGANGASFQYRTVTEGASATADSTVAVAPPYWVKIERVGENIAGSVSADGKTWSRVGSSLITMEDPVLIGLAVTSHLAGENRTYQFEGITLTGTVTGDWKGAVIDKVQYNAAANMYVTITDSAGKSATVTSATAALAADWTRWVIRMSDFAGVNFGKVARMVIGVGDKSSPTAGGTGTVFIDDIGYGRSVK
jgi:hypothetical protein